MIIMFVVLAIVIAAVGLWTYSHSHPSTFNEATRRAVVDLYAIRARDNLREYKREVRRNADHVRKELDRELGSK